MKTRKLCILALLAAIALSIWAAEAAIPPIVPLPGIRLGLANVVTLLTLYLYGRREAAAVLAVRLILGAALAGTLMSFLYSLAGGLFALGVMALLRPRVGEKRVWMLSAYAAAAHNIGQLLAARLVMGTPGLWWYLPPLLLSGVLTGAFTGLCARFVLPVLKKNK
jgi:heptaprenyl diphosphate synthase